MRWIIPTAVSRLLCLLWLAPGHVASAQDLLPLVGGTGGTSFAQVCPRGSVLTGIRARRGDTLHAIGIRCRPVRADGSLSPEVEEGPVWGGPGGSEFAQSCPPGNVIAEQSARVSGERVTELAYHCYRWVPATRRWSRADRGASIVVLRPADGTTSQGNALTSTRCPSPAGPADGVRGRSALRVEAVGIRCEPP